MYLYQVGNDKKGKTNKGKIYNEKEFNYRISYSRIIKW